LWFSNNKLTGTVPTEIGLLISLTTSELSNNTFTYADANL